MDIRLKSRKHVAQCLPCLGEVNKLATVKGVGAKVLYELILQVGSIIEVRRLLEDRLYGIGISARCKQWQHVAVSPVFDLSGRRLIE